MRTPVRCAVLALAGAAAAVGLAPLVGAAPRCTDLGPTVTYCETNGSAQLTTQPPPWNVGGWYGGGGWPIYGGFGYGPQ